MLQKNDCIELTITDLTTEASGVGHYEGMAVFVPMSAVGDLLRVRIVKVLKSHCFGIIEEILTPSPHRIPVDCPVYRQCGGCSLRHISYENECAIKQNWVYQHLRRIGGIEIAPVPLLSTGQTDGYRNKAQYPVALGEKGPDIGFYAKRSHRVIPHHSCLIQPRRFADILDTVADFVTRYRIPPYHEENHRGLLRHIYLRQGEATGQVMLCLVLTEDNLPHAEQLVQMVTQRHPEVCSILLNINSERTNVILGRRERLLYGKGQIEDVLCGITFSISAQAFYQVNRRGAELLYGVAKDFAALKPTDILLDLYCGAGTIGLSMAKEVREVIGVEIVPDAVENAKTNAAKNGIENARFLCGDAAYAAGQLASEGIRPNVILVDPPRKGCAPELLETIAEMAPERLVYVSCNSATMARDARLLAALGYSVTRVQAVDMFPRTAHVEAVVLFVRTESDAAY